MSDKLQEVFLRSREDLKHCDQVTDLTYGDEPQQVMDLIRPPGNGPFPVLIYIHGGAWISGDKSANSLFCSRFSQAGVLTFNVNYRLAPEFPFPAQIQDVARAIQWVHDHAGDYGGDISRIYLAGDSAGAHLALWYTAALYQPGLFQEVGISQPIPRQHIRGNLLYYGLFDLENVASRIARTVIAPYLQGDRQGNPGRVELVSPIRFLHPSLPPLLVVCGERDIIYDQSRTLIAALEKIGARHEALIFDAREHRDAWHSFLKYPHRRCARAAAEVSIRFLFDSPASDWTAGKPPPEPSLRP